MTSRFIRKTQLFPRRLTHVEYCKATVFDVSLISNQSCAAGELLEGERVKTRRQHVEPESKVHDDARVTAERRLDLGLRARTLRSRRRVCNLEDRCSVGQVPGAIGIGDVDTAVPPQSGESEM